MFRTQKFNEMSDFCNEKNRKQLKKRNKEEWLKTETGT